MDKLSSIAIKLLMVSNSVEIKFSSTTKKFYVTQPMVEMSEKGFLIGPTCHEDTPDEALRAYFNRLKNGRVVVGAYTSFRKEYVFDAEEGVFVRR